MQGVANTIKCYSGQTFEGPDGVNDWSFGKNIEEKECENGVTQCLKIGANIMGGKLSKSRNQPYSMDPNKCTGPNKHTGWKLCQKQ